MSAKFDLNDDGVVVVIGSGAGGGGLSNDLAQKGVKVVCLEAGGRHLPQDYQNDEWGSFGQISWLDARTTSGDWRVAKDFSGLPSWIVKAVGGSTVHWAGASLRFQEHEFKTKTVYGDVQGASLLDWPIGLSELEPYYDKAEKKLGVTRTNGIPGCQETTTSKSLRPAQRRLATNKSIPGEWRLTVSHVMEGLIASRLVSVSRVVSSAPSGLPHTQIFPRARQPVTWRFAPTLRH